MVAAMEIPAVRERALPISAAAYHLMFESGVVSEKTELIEGVVIEKMPKSALHVFLVEEIRRLFDRLLPDDLRVRQEQPLALGYSEPEPDLAIVTTAMHSDLSGHPSKAQLVIEVANTTLPLDREKAAVYAKARIPRYLILNLNERVVEDFTQPSDGRYLEKREYPFGALTLWSGIEFDLSRF